MFKKKQEKEKNTENKPKKTMSKWIILGVIIAIIVSAISFGTYYLISRNSKDVFSNLTVFEDGSYYLTKVKKNMSFDIIPNEGADENSLYTIIDENNNNVETIDKTKDGYITIKPPKGNYTPGATYTLTLNNAVFKDEALKDVKVLVFKIDKKEIAEYEYKENVKILSKSDVEIITANDITTIKTSAGSFQENDIIILNDNENLEAYKVTKIEGDILTVTTPLLTEIYNKLEVYETYEIDYNSIVIDDALKDQVEIAFKKSAIYKFLENECYAASPDTTIKITPSKDSILVDISVTMLPDRESNLGIKALANHKVTITFKYEFKCTPSLDINLPTKVDITTEFAQNLDFNINIVPDEEILTGIKELTEEEYNKSVMEIVNKLSNIEYDKASGNHDIITIPINTKIPGLTFNIDFFTLANFNFATDVTFNHTANSNLITGLLITQDGCKSYCSKFAESKDTEFTITGKTDFEFGIGLDTNLVFISEDIAYAKIVTETGLYGDAYITFPLIHSNKQEGLITTDYVGSLDIGLFLRSNFDAKVDLLVKEIKASKNLLDYKMPILECGNDTITKEIITETESVTIKDGKITIPTFEKTLLNILTNETKNEKLDTSLLKFVNGANEQLIVEENTITVPDANDTITVIYTENNKEFKTTFDVKKEEKNIKIGSSTLKFGKYKVEWDIPKDATITINSDGTATYVGYMYDTNTNVNLTGTWKTKANSVYGLEGSPDNPNAVNGISFNWSNGTTEVFGVSTNYFGDQWHGYKWVSE